MQALYMFIFVSLISVSTLALISNACDDTRTLCSPKKNETWYHQGNYTFVFNQNYTLFVNSNILNLDLHLTTQIDKSERTVKSWLNLTNIADLSVQVTDDWFPDPITSDNNNKTWTMYAFLLPHDTPLPPFIQVPTTEYDMEGNPFVQFNVVQSPHKPIIIQHEKMAHKWILAIIVIACVLLIVAIGTSIWFWRRMKKIKQTNAIAYHQKNPSNPMLQSSILSTTDAVMIADTFRQAMSTSEMDKSRAQVGEDLLRRQLASEGTSVLQVERKTSSTTTKKELE